MDMSYIAAAGAAIGSAVGSAYVARLLEPHVQLALYRLGVPRQGMGRATGVGLALAVSLVGLAVAGIVLLGCQLFRVSYLMIVLQAIICLAAAALVGTVRLPLTRDLRLAAVAGLAGGALVMLVLPLALASLS